MIKKYKKKPVVIEAVQFNGNNSEEIRDFMEVAEQGIHLEGHDTGAYMLIDTLEGTMKASKGDYIIKGVQGEFYPCKPDIFKDTYEEV